MKLTEEEKRLNAINQELKILNDTQKMCVKKIKELETSKKQIENKNKPDILVSDHAILRYYERFFNANVEEIKAKIVSEFNSHNTLLKNGSGKLITDEITYVVQHNKIVTLY